MNDLYSGINTWQHHHHLPPTDPGSRQGRWRWRQQAPLPGWSARSLLCPVSGPLGPSWCSSVKPTLLALSISNCTKATFIVGSPLKLIHPRFGNGETWNMMVENKIFKCQSWLNCTTKHQTYLRHSKGLFFLLVIWPSANPDIDLIPGVQHHHVILIQVLWQKVAAIHFISLHLTSL